MNVEVYSLSNRFYFIILLYRAENISVFVEDCNFKILMPKKFRPAGDYGLLKVSTLKVNNCRRYRKCNKIIVDTTAGLPV